MEVMRRLVTRGGTGLPVALFAMVAGGCGDILRGPIPVTFEREEWSFSNAKGAKLTSEHYVIHTTCKSKPFTDALPQFVESCWSAYAELLPSDRAPDRPLETYLFQTRWQWERFTEEFAGARADTYMQIRSGGYSERGVTVSHYGTRRQTLSILAHEGLHQYLEVTHGRPIPAWVNEGLACYFESFDLTPDGRAVFVPERNSLRTPALREALRTKSLQPLSQILATDAGREIHKPSAGVLTYYAEAWSLVVFLMRPRHVNPYHDGFRQMLRDLGTDAMERKARAFMAADTDGRMSRGEAIFRAYVTDDTERFWSDYEQYLYQLLSMAG